MIYSNSFFFSKFPISLRMEFHYHMLHRRLSLLLSLVLLFGGNASAQDFEWAVP